MPRNILHRLFVVSVVGLTCLGSVSTVWAGPSADQTARSVDQLLAEEIRSQSESTSRTIPEPAERVSDEIFLRRVMLDLVGQPPSLTETLLFSLDPAEDKRAKVVDNLLEDKRYGSNWAGFWRDIILYRRSEERALFTTGALTEYLTQQFNDNVSWDEIARSFITASGDVRTEGKTALIMAQGGKPEDTVAEISRIFMGIQIQCAQCHDHPTDDWKREQFHQLAAFFPRVAVRPNNQGQQRSFVVYSSDTEPRFQRRNPNNRYRGTLEHRMPDLNKPSAKGTLMQPILFATGQKLKTGTSDSDRRGALAKWITSADNPWFSKAVVNRLWSELVGEGFYEPVDDMGPQRQCTAPKTLDYLAAAFVESGHDMKWLMRTIITTEAYQRASRSRRAANVAPFAANCSQRLRADQLYDSLAQALGLPSQVGDQRGAAANRFRRTPRALFNFEFGYDPSTPRKEIAGSIPQALVLMNSPLINQAIDSDRGQLGRLLTREKDNEAVTVELYLNTLSRQPTREEIKVCLDFVKEVGDRREAFQDVLWSLVNSTEFLHRR